MNVKRWGSFLAGCGLLLAATGASAYTLIKDNGGYVVRWAQGPIPMQVKLATSPALSDGTSLSASVVAAMAAWNSQLGVVQFAPQELGPGAYSNGNGVNEIVMDSTIGGDAFDSNTLAVTISWRSGDERTESDIVFNTAWTWDSYRGSLRAAEDIRRVAIHELGHVLGLDHPDQAGQSVTAIMNSAVSNVDALQADDLAGGHTLYGSPGFVPANNNFANATAVVLASGSAQFLGDNLAATTEPGEPALDATDPTRKTVWWKWTAPTGGGVTLDTLGSDFDTLLGVFTGSAVNSLSLVALNDDQQAGVIRTSRVIFTATAGTTYYFAVDGSSGYYGAITLNLNFAPNAVPPAITSQPNNRSAVAGQTAQFTVNASGSQTLLYVWQVAAAGSSTWTNTSSSSSGGTSSTITLYPDLSYQGNRYRCMVSNSGGSVTSNEAVLTVTGTAPLISYQPSNAATTVGSNAAFSCYVSGSGPISLRWQVLTASSGAWANLDDDGYYTGATVATLNITGPPLAFSGNQYRCVATNGLGSVTSNAVSLTVNAAAPPVIRNFPASVVNVAYGDTIWISAQADGTAPISYQWYKNGVAIPWQNSSYFQKSTATQADSGLYTFRVTNIAGSVTADVQVAVAAPIAPAITRQPAAVVAGKGSSTGFNVAVTGSSPMRYQWFKDGIALSGGTYPSYSMSSITAADSGFYSVRIANDAGVVTSAAAELVVLNAARPTVTASGPAQISSTSSTLSLQATTTGTSPLTYQWFKDGVAVAGAVYASYMKTSAGPGDAGRYYVQVTNEAGIAASNDVPVDWSTADNKPWIDAVRLGDIGYFLAAAPSRIMRYDFAAESWLPIVYLGETRVPTAFLPTNEGIFVAYNRNLVRHSLDLQSETAVATSASTIQSLWAIDNLVVFADSSATRSWNRTSLAAGPSSPVGLYYYGLAGSQRPAFSPTLRKLFYTRPNTSPNDIMVYTVAGDGTITGAGDSPYHGDFAIGIRQYLSPNEGLLFDNSGVVYETAGLNYSWALGSAFDDLAFLSSGTPVTLRGNRLTAYSTAGYYETGQVTLAATGSGIFARGTDIFAFGAPANNASNPTVTKVAAASFAAPSTTALDPAGRQFSADLVLSDGTGVLYYVSRSTRSIVRWDANNRQFLPSVPLRGMPAFFSQARFTNQLILAYVDGVVTRLDLDAGTPEEVYASFNRYNYLMDLVAMDNVAALHIHAAGHSADRYLVLGAAGEARYLSTWNYYGRGLAWLSGSRRYYSTNAFSIGTVGYYTVPTTGVMPGATEGTVTNVQLPLRFSDDDTLAFTGDGRILNADLQAVGTLSNTVIDGVWNGSSFYSLRERSNGTEIQKWARITYTLGSSVTVAGTPLGIHNLPGSKLAVSTLVDGRLAVYVLDADLTVLSSDFNAAGSYNGIAHSATGRQISVDAGQAVMVSHTVQNTGTKPWGANHTLTVRNAANNVVAQFPLAGVPFGGARTVSINLTAPASGSQAYSITAAESGVAFGASATFSLVVAATTNGLAYAVYPNPGNVPAGSPVDYTYTVVNSGTKPWGANHFLVLKDPSGNNVAFGALAGTAAGGSKVVTLSFTAPATPGNYAYRIQGLENGVEWFGPLDSRTLTVISPANGISYSGSTFPGSVLAGSDVTFNCLVTNTGTKTWGANHFLVLKNPSGANIAFADLNGTIAGGVKLVTFSFPAPTTGGTYAYKMEALENGVEWFGGPRALSLAVTAVALPVNGITYGASTFPASATGGTTVTFTRAVTNSGTKAWGANHFLGLKDSSGTTIAFGDLSGTAPGQSKVLTFSFQAPSAAGAYAYKLEALENGVEWFGGPQSLPLTVTAAVPVNGITYGANTFPASVTVGASVSFTCTVTNAGTGMWGANHFLVLKDPSGANIAFADLSGMGSLMTRVVTLSFIAPATPGAYTYKVEALQNGVAWFGGQQSLPLTVTGMAAPTNGINHGSTTFPASVTASSTVAFDYFVTNTGTKTWGANHYLVLKDLNGINLAFGALAGTAPGEGRTVHFSFVAPTTAGFFTYKFEALENGLEWFGGQVARILQITGAPPPANGISFGATDFPAGAAAGTGVSFNYTVTNTGTNPWGSEHYLVLKDPAGANIAFASLAGTAAGQSKTVTLSFIAPAAGSYTYLAQALENGVAWFGAAQPLSITTTAPVSLTNGITYNYVNLAYSGFTGEVVTVNCQVVNSGTKPWGPDHYLVIRDSSGANIAFKSLDGVAPGPAASAFQLTFLAPGAPGMFEYKLLALENGVEWFGEERGVGIIVDHPGATNGITINSITLPASAPAGTYVDIICNVTNSGTKNWLLAHSVILWDDTTGTPVNLVTMSTFNMAPGASRTVQGRFLAPLTTGTHTLRLQGYDSSDAHPEFGTASTRNLLITPFTDAFNAVVESYSMPGTTTTGAGMGFFANVTNLGPGAWNDPRLSLTLRDLNGAAIATKPLPQVPAGGRFQAWFAFNAPATAGDYHYRIEAALDGVGTFEASPGMALTVMGGTGQPIISRQPVSRTVGFSQSVQFDLAATGAGPIAYQWQRQAPGATAWTDLVETSASPADIAGVQQPVLKMSLLLLGNDGAKFRCVVSNSAGSVTTDPVTLGVQGSGVGMTNGLVFVNHDMGVLASAARPVTFQYTVTNTGSKNWGAQHYLVLKDSSGTALGFMRLDGTPVGGNLTVNFYLVAPAAPGNYTYKVEGLENGVEWFGSPQTLTLTVVP